jgi:calcineurin-like phosphoesterase family protein
MKTFFTADYHLGHGNIIRYCSRPFKDLNEMNDTIIRNHNERVKPGDIVYFAGDFCFRNSPGGKQGEGIIHKADYYKKQLNGDMIFIKGNHDRNNSLKTNVEKVYIQYGGHKICIVHNPVHADSTTELNFVGHVHEKWKFRHLSTTSYMINIGVDVWRFKPITFEEIMREFKHWRRNAKLIESAKVNSKTT